MNISARSRLVRPTEPTINRVVQTFKELGVTSGGTYSNFKMLGIGTNPGSTPVGAGDNRDITIKDAILQPDPSTFDGVNDWVKWIERGYMMRFGTRENVIYRSNELHPDFDPATVDEFWAKLIREHFHYGNHWGWMLFKNCWFLASGAQAFQSVGANTADPIAKKKIDPKTGLYLCERQTEVGLDNYEKLLASSGTLELAGCVASECGSPAGAGRAASTYSFFCSPLDIHIHGGSITCLGAPPHQASGGPRHSFGAIHAEAHTNFRYVDPVTGKGTPWQSQRAITIEDLYVFMVDPDRAIVNIQDFVSPVEIRGGEYHGGKIVLSNNKGGVNIQGVEGTAPLWVDGVYIGPVSKGYSKAAA